MAVFYAHTAGSTTDKSRWQRLAHHLANVARIARRFAEETRPGDSRFADAAEWAGWLHDLGKYRPEFQEMLDGTRAKGESTRHKQAGAAVAYNQKRYDLAFVIAGHHGGIPDKQGLKELIAAGTEVAQANWPIAVSDCPELTRPLHAHLMANDPLAFELFVRLLFSCLVDADWQDTSEHHRVALGVPAPPLTPELCPESRLSAVLDFIASRAATCPSRRIAQIRAQVLDAAMRAAQLPTGLFSLSVPTGGGKTLSSLAFALAHAAARGLRRVIYVAPYLSIIEQNADVFRAALGVDSGSGAVLEHHSLADLGDGSEDSSAAQRLAENWDAPVVVTTSVQFYESLFSNQPGRCRKLHNIARSVIILDECQALPADLTHPTVQMLGSVASGLGSSIVLCTATQPAWHAGPLLPEGLNNVREIIPGELDLFGRLRRVRVQWPRREERWDWPTVAERMLASHQALCVVNTKNAAREVYHQLKSSGSVCVLHLSTAMCPAHRLTVLARVRELLSQGRPCHLVSTQLIEAGVDVDFPLVLRELAPLDGVVQAAGRCNREGLLNGPDGEPGGQVIVFRSERGVLPPDGWYRGGVATLEQDFLALGREPDIGKVADLAEYFHRLYHCGNLDQRNIIGERRSLNFQTVAHRYKLIDDGATVSVVTMQWKTVADEVMRLITQLRNRPSRELFRALGRYQVNLFATDYRLLQGTITTDDPVGVNQCHAPYDDELGLVPQGTAEALVV